MELAYTRDLKSLAVLGLRVRVPPRLPLTTENKLYNTKPKDLAGWNRKQLERLKRLLLEARKEKSKTIQFNHWNFNTLDVENFLNDLY